jgi:succinate dehydrogenase / fumarate reductase cytochrome b subunit
MSTAAEHASDSHSVHAGFVRDRLGTILALAPLGVWVVNHLWNNLAAFQGAKDWQQAVTGHAHPVSELITFVLVLVPLFIHVIWGLRRLRHMKPNNGSYGYFGNLKFVLQRLSALGVLAFLGAHLWLAFLSPRFFKHQPEQFTDIAYEMAHNPPTLVVYLLGTLGVAYHLANGISTSAMALGLAVSPRAHKRFDTLAVVVLVLLLVMAWGAIFALYRAGAAIPTMPH